MIKAEIIADSINEFGDRITTMKVTFPRIILAEFNTHRMFSRNSASSRAIPFKKMVEAVNSNPFTPIAWQEDHKGMQGVSYLDDKPASYLNPVYVDNIQGKDILDGYWSGKGEYEWPSGSALYHMIDIARLMSGDKATKQLANRLLEPFMWHTCIVTSTEWENFFDLRCPQYVHVDGGDFKSRKDFLKYLFDKGYDFAYEVMKDKPFSHLDWLELNKGQAEIHMMATAEAMYDALQESMPRKLKAGEWHIPYADKIDWNIAMPETMSGQEIHASGGKYPIQIAIKISTAMCARVSYTTIGEEKSINYKNLVDIHDRMYNQKPFHASPFEHIAQAMGKDDLDNFIKMEDGVVDAGWCRNFKGFKQYRYIVEKMQKPLK